VGARVRRHDSSRDGEPHVSPFAPSTARGPTTLHWRRGGGRLVLSFFAKLFDTSDFPARWHCGSWDTFLGVLHIASDLVIFAAYVAIPVVLVVFLRRRKDLPFPKVFWLFSAFIIACGFVHLVEAIIFYHPLYRVSGLLKLVTAVVSVATVGALIPTMPKALVLRSPEELKAEVERQTQALKQAEDRFRVVVENTQNAIVMLDSKMTIGLCNPAGERLFGWNEADLQGEHLSVLLPDETRPHHQKLVDNYMSSPVARPMGAARDLLARTKEGSLVPVEVGLMPVEVDDERFVIASLVDISTRRAAEEQQAQLIAELQLKNEELEKFTRVASHDLQEPLRSIVSYAELLELKYAKDLDDKAKSYLDHLTAGGRRMQALLNDLLAYARSQKTPEAKPIPLQEVFNTVVADLRLAVSDVGGAVELPDHFPAVVGDEVNLHQLFLNLIGNGLKFARPGVPPVVAVDVELDEAWCTVRVADNGVGVPQSSRAQVFEPFFRLHGRDEVPGTGIGLAICKKIAQQHGGDIHIEDNDDGGATFVVRLPSAEASS